MSKRSIPAWNLEYADGRRRPPRPSTALGPSLLPATKAETRSGARRAAAHPSKRTYFDTKILAVVLAFLLGAAAVSCKGRDVPSSKQKVVVKYRYVPGAIASHNPQPEFRCVAFRIDVSNAGYERVEFDRESFSNEANGKVYPAAPESRCSAGAAPPPAALKTGESWRGVVAFEQPVFSLDSRILLKPRSVKGLPFGADPQIEYSIAPN